jgi:hypothetical protein
MQSYRASTKIYHERSVGLFVFGFLLACYLLTYTGVIQSSDGLSIFATTESIVRRGEVDSNQLLWMGLQQGSFGADGELYSRKGAGSILAALPLVWLAQWWEKIGMVRAALLLNPLLTAWTGALIYRLGCMFQWNQAASLFAALSYGLATLAWPYTQEFFSEPLCAWGLLLAFHALQRYRQLRYKRYLFLSGLAWGLAYLARTINLVTLPIFLAAALTIVFEPAHVEGSLLRQLIQRQRLSALLRRYWRPLVFFLFPVVLSGALSLWWNWLRFGSVWDTGYLESERFNGDWLFGIFGLLLSPGRGIIWYSPVLLLGVFGLRWFWRNQRLSFTLIALLSLCYLLLYAKWYMWHGGFSWGPRFLVPALPFWALLTGPAWQWFVSPLTLSTPQAISLAISPATSPLISPATSWRRNAGRIGVVLLVLISAALQWLGMLLPFGIVQNWLAENVQPLFAPHTFVEWRYSPLLMQWNYLSDHNIILAWRRHENGQVGIDWLALAMPLSGILAGLTLLIQEIRNYWHDAASGGWRNFLYGAALAVIALAVLTYHPLTNAEQTIHLIGEQILNLEQPDDAILHLEPSQNQAFSDHYRGRLPVYGLTPQIDLDASSQRWLQHLQQNYQRIWVVPDGMPPDASGWERRLRVEDYLLWETRLPDAQGRRLALYASTSNNPRSEVGLGVIFGDPARPEATVRRGDGWIRLLGYSTTQQTHPGDAILLELRWQSLRRVDYDYHVFVHLLNSNGEKLAQRDGQPVQWLRPITTWQVGEQIIDHYGILLPETVPPGEYTLAIGLYDPVTGQRLPVVTQQENYAVQIGPINVSLRPSFLNETGIR